MHELFRQLLGNGWNKTSIASPSPSPLPFNAMVCNIHLNKHGGGISYPEGKDMLVCLVGGICIRYMGLSHFWKSGLSHLTIYQHVNKKVKLKNHAGVQ